MNMYMYEATADCFPLYAAINSEVVKHVWAAGLFIYTL